MWRFKSIPKLHQAVLDNNLEEIGLLQNHSELSTQTDSLGFTALEIAHLLGRDEAAKLLVSKRTSKFFKVQLPYSEFVREYSKIRFEQIFDIIYLPGLRFASYQQLKNVVSNCPMLIKLGIEQQSRELGNQYRLQIWKGDVANLSIRWIDEFIGFGAFAEDAIFKGSYVGEYTGFIKRIYRSKPDLNAYSLHYPTRFWSLQYYVVDAQPGGNEMRFVNHSDDPNLEPIFVYDRGLLRQCFIAKEDIARGEELTFNYGPDYWIKRKKMALP